MTDLSEPSAARKWALRAIMIIFVLSAAWAAWYGNRQQQLHGSKADGKAKDPYEDRSLFGR